MRYRPATGCGATAVPRWASKWYATTRAVRAEQDDLPGRLRGHGGGGLRCYAHYYPIGDGGVAYGGVAHGGVAHGGVATARERAVADAAAILKAFVVPPGGQRLQKAPDVLKFPSSTIVSTALVDDVSFWQPPRPASVRVPSAARVARIIRLPSPGPYARRPPAPAMITDLAVVRRLAVLVDSLQLSTIGPDVPCPASLGGEIRLTFLAADGGLPLAVAQPAPCGTVQFSVGGKPQPALQITDSFIPQLLKLAGLHWKVL